MRILTHKKTAKRKNQIRHQRNVERLRMRITKGDTVRVMRGDDRGKKEKCCRCSRRRAASRSTA